MNNVKVVASSFTVRVVAALKRTVSKNFHGFTLAELIVVITVLAILATVGFLSLSWYTSDARDAAMKANVRSITTAISAESAATGNSPRFYVVHDPEYALSWAFLYVDGTPYALTGGNVGEAPADSNYSAGKPDFQKLRMDPEKFRISFGFPINVASDFLSTAFAATAPESQGGSASWFGIGSEVAAWAVEITAPSVSGRHRVSSFFQAAAILPETRAVSVSWNFPLPTQSDIANAESEGKSVALWFVRNPLKNASSAVLEGDILPGSSSDSSWESSGGGSGDPVSYTFAWKTTAWGSCTNGEKTRTVFCERNDSQAATDSDCSSAGEKPGASDSCQWSEIEGTSCSKSDVSVAVEGGATRVWAACNSVLWTSSTAYSWPCYNYAWADSNDSALCSSPTSKENFAWISSDSRYAPAESDNVFGKLYQFDTDIAGSGKCDTKTVGWRTVYGWGSDCACPSWWHIPSDAEWIELFASLNWGTACETESSDGWGMCAGLWWMNSNAKAADANVVRKLGLPLSGYCFSGSCYVRGNVGHYWSSTVSWAAAYRHSLYYSYDNLGRTTFNKSYALSVRCMKDY